MTWCAAKSNFLIEFNLLKESYVCSAVTLGGFPEDSGSLASVSAVCLHSSAAARLRRLGSEAQLPL